VNAADVMTRNVITTTADASVDDVARLMVFHRASLDPIDALRYE